MLVGLWSLSQVRRTKPRAPTLFRPTGGAPYIHQRHHDPRERSLPMNQTSFPELNTYGPVARILTVALAPLVSPVWGVGLAGGPTVEVLTSWRG